MAGNLTFTNIFMHYYPGSYMRIVLRATNLGTVSWPAYVVWPGGIVPSLASGPRKEALITLIHQNESSVLLGSATMY
jgi:hypothetical protein